MNSLCKCSASLREKGRLPHPYGHASALTTFPIPAVRCGPMRPQFPLFVATILIALSAPLASQTPPPLNVVLIMTDDQGLGDFGFAGNPIIRTPNIDAMAHRGTRLASFYVCPTCAPHARGS